MSELDQISRLLGNIEAKQDATSQRVDAISSKLGALHDNNEEIRKEVKLVAARLDTIESDLKLRIEPSVEELQDLKHKGMGVVAAMSVVFTVIGYAASKLIKHFFHV
jgi:archaellum component FlaC